MTRAALSSVAIQLSARTRRAGAIAVILAAALHVVVAGQQAGTNVNIVKGTTLPNGDPFLQRQTEPSVAVSTRNPCHLAASAVDYRTVDLEHQDDVNPTQLATGDAWLGFYKSFDCGQRWQSHLIPGYRGDTSPDGLASPIRGFDAGADGVVRAAANGLFYYVGMVFQRDESASKVFVSRFIDSNNKERGDTIEFAGTSVVATGNPTHFLDKPWIAVDIPRKPLAFGDQDGDRNRSRGTDDDRAQDGVCFVNGQRVAAGNVYVGWTNFDIAATTETSRIMFARSTNCGRTFQQQAIVEHSHPRPRHDHGEHRGDRDYDGEDEDNEANRVVQGTAIAIAPSDGAVYVAWRQFARNGLPAGIFTTKSTDGGNSFSSPQQIALVSAFDQERGLTTFRSNAMPTIAADPAGRVYVAWAERGYATAPGRGDKVTGDARIVLAVSPDRGRTWLPRYAIDNSYVDDKGVRKPLVGHQVMPSLTFGAGRLHAMWYDFRADPCVTDPARAMQPSCGATNGVPNYQYVDGIDHLVGVQSASAAIGPQPAFTSVLMSQFRQSIDADGKVHSQTSHANLPLYSQGSRSFLGDYVDAAALIAVPTRPAKNVQEWVPNTGLLSGPAGRPDPSGAPMAGFTTLPIFHGVWTDTRDVKPPLNGDWTLYFPPKSPSSSGAQCNPDTAGMRDANIYSSRVTPGVYVGSPGNAKPLGFVVREGVRQHLQRAFVVFVQNPLRDTRYYRLTIVNQPGPAVTDRASFNQFPAPPFSTRNPSDKLHDPRIAPLTQIWISVPPISTVSRNVYVTAADPTAQVRVDVDETVAPVVPPPPPPGQTPPPAPPPVVKINGLRSSILLNPDPTSPPLTGPDVAAEVPDIAALEVHEPIVDDPIFFNINDPRSRTSALRTPADQNPADQNPADQNVGDLNPADQNPADQNPADQNPADQNSAVEAVAFTDNDVTGPDNVIRDVHFPVKNNGNTTTRYFFKPVVQSTSPDRKYQLLVTVRNNTLTVDDCTLKFDPQQQVLVNISDFKPRTPADQNPADQNPADQNPADQNPADQNPADQNPADQNSSFFLAPGDQATVTLRIYAPAAEAATLPAPNNNQVALLIRSASANTGETVAPSASGGADLTVNDLAPQLDFAQAEPGDLLNLSWTLKNRGTSPAVSSNGSIITQFYLSTNSTVAFTPGDVLLASTSREGDIPACTTTQPTGCAFSFTQPLTIPAATALSSYFIKVITDPSNGDFPGGRVFEADKVNNVSVVAITIVSINDAPSFARGPNQSTLRNAGAQTVPNWATNISAGPPNEATQTLNFIVTNNNAALFSQQPAISPAGTLTFTPATGVTGAATVTVTLHDNGGTANGGIDTSAPQTFIVSVTAVNDPPAFTKGADQTTLEDAGPQTVPNWATNISAGPPDEAGQLVDFVVSNSNPALFAAQPAVSPTGTLTYTVAPDANGIATVTTLLHDNGGTANGGVDASAPQTFTIAVAAVNDAPTFTLNEGVSVSADGGTHSVPGVATNFSPGPPDESGQRLAAYHIVSSSNPALFAVQPSVTGGISGLLYATDANGGHLLTVDPTTGAGTIVGATGVQNVPSLAVDPITGAMYLGGGSGNPLVYTVDPTTGVAALLGDSGLGFAAIDGLDFTPAGVLYASVNIVGDGGTGGDHLAVLDKHTGLATVIGPFGSCSSTSCTIEGIEGIAFDNAGQLWGTHTARGRAGAPGLYKIDPATGAATFVTAYSNATGAPAPSGGIQSLHFTIDGALYGGAARAVAPATDGGYLVRITPATGAVSFVGAAPATAGSTLAGLAPSPAGTLTFGLAPNASGVAVIGVTAQDNGGTGNGGVDTSAVQTLTVTVTANTPTVNHAPTFTNGPDQTIAQNAGPQTVVAWATNISAGDGDTGQLVNFITTNDNNALFSSQPSIDPDGSLHYTPSPTASGTATVTVQLHDDGGTANGGIDSSAPQTFTITVTAVTTPAVNHAPSFTKGTDQIAAEDAGSQTVPQWATNVSDGDGTGQSVTFVTTNDNPGLFLVQPAVDPDGTLHYTSASNAFGTATVTLRLHDDGGTANGGIDTSASQAFTITVTPVNDAPVANDDVAFTTTNTPIDIPVVANDTDVDNGTGGTILAARAFGPTSIGFPSQLAVDALSGHVYVQTARAFGVVDTTQPAATALVASIAAPFLGATQHRVDPATRLIYFRAATAAAQNLITVVNPAINQIVGTLSFTNINAFAIDSARSRLYVVAGGQLLLVDAAPASPTFLQTLFAMPLGSAGVINAVAVDGAANRVYIAAGSGVWTVDGSNGNLTQIADAPAPSSEIAVDETRHRVFAAGTNGSATTVAVIDGQTNAVIGNGLSASGVVNNGSTGKRLVVNAATGNAYVRTTDAAFGNGWVVAIDPTGPTATAIALGARDDGVVGIASDDALNRVVTTADADLQLIVVDAATNQVSARLHTPEVADGTVDLDATRHRAYVSLFSAIATVDTQAQTVSTLPIAVEAASGIVNPTTHTFYLAITSDRAAIDVFDSAGQATPVTGLPHQDGRYVFLGRDRTTGLFYAPNNITNAAGTNDGQPGFVAEIDSATNQVTQTIDAGNAPFGLAVNSTTHKVYVGNLAINGVRGGITEVTPAAHTSTAIDVSSLQDSATVLLNIGRSMAINETTNRLYFQVLSGSNATGAVVDLANGNAVTRLPVSGTWGTIREFEVDSVRNRVFVATDPVGSTPGRLHILDGSTHAEIAAFDVFSASSAANTQASVRVDETRGLVYVSDFARNTLTIIDATANTVKAALPVCNGPGAVGINLAANRAYVACSKEFALTFVDGNGPGGTARVAGHLPLPFQPGFLHVDEAASLVYVASGSTPAPGLSIVRDLNGALDGVLAPASASTPTAQGGTTAINPNGTIHYTPPANFAGIDTFSYTATDGQALSNAAGVTVTVGAGPVITTASTLPPATINQNYTQQLAATGRAPLTWYLPTNNQLPVGLSINSAGLLTGVPTSTGAFSFGVAVVDAAGATTQATFTLVVNGSTLTLTTTSLRDAVIIENYGFSLSSAGGAGTKAFSVLSGALPPGITLNGNGSFSGIATKTGTFPFVAQVVDCAASTCQPGQTLQTATRALTLQVDVREQQAGGPTQPSISFGGPGGRKIAQVVTVGAQGTLAGVGINNVTCPSAGPVTVDIQRLTLAGLPDGQTIATGTASNSFFVISVAPTIDLAIGARYAFVVSSPTACNILATATDSYQAGDAYADAGGGWQPLLATDGVYDLPFRTLIQPALPVAYLIRSHGGHTATRLLDGRVLLAGNDTTAEVYDPASNAATLTGNPMRQRSNATATLLGDGTVLIAGGRDFNGVITATTEIYDPATGTFAAGPAMSVAREAHTATRLADDRVLVAGGDTSDLSSLRSAEVYDPVLHAFVNVGNMVAFRNSHAATLLSSGRVLLTGGYNNLSVITGELFDPASNTFTPTAGSMIVPFRGRATATLLQDGKVLIAGGQPNDVVSSAELYDPIADAFAPTGAMATRRFFHTATLLDDGSVLIAGGSDQPQAQNYTLPLADLERYIPATGTFVRAGGLEARRASHTATALQNGTVLIAGGFGQSFMTVNTVEFYDAAVVPALATTTLPDGQPGSLYPPTTLAATGGSGGPYQIVAFGALPPGIAYNAATFTLSGTPTATGVFSIGFTVTDSQAHSNVQSLTLRVGAINTITSPFRLIDAAINRPYDVQLAATGAVPLIWSLAPASSPLPQGLTLGSTGRITGTPTVTGFFQFAARAVDATGQLAIKTLAIFVRNPLLITAASALADGVLAEFYGGCLTASDGSGARTWSVTTGSLPRGVSLQSNGCFTGVITSRGTFTFTARITDQSAPPQTDSKSFTVSISSAADQGTGFDTSQPALSFGGAVRVAQQVRAGVTGTLQAAQLFGLTCPAGTSLTAQIQGLLASGTPDGTVVSSGSASTPGALVNSVFTVPLTAGVPFAADAGFALVFLADQTCQLHPNAFDSYSGGDAYVSSSSTWQPLRSFDGRYDISFETVVTPRAELSFMTTFRGAHTATVLADGRVLIAGGNTATAEIYDPVTGLTTATGSMSVSRRDHTATLLDDGTVLIAGGVDQSNTVYFSSAEIYHPSSGTFELLSAPMSTNRATHTATKLADGRVLIAGGQSGVCCSTDLASAEIYNPAARTFTAIAPMHAQRRNPTATLLLDRRVLIAGGWGTGFGSAELFDAATATFALPVPMPVRSQHTATRLADGQVLLAGGAGDLGNALTSAVTFDPLLGTFTPTPPMATPHIFATATLLDDGSVLVAGGQSRNVCCEQYPPQAVMERYQPGSNTWVGAGSLLVARYFHSASALTNGTVLFAGTFGASAAGGRSVEIFNPATAVSLVDAAPPSGRTGDVYAGFSFAGQGGSGGPYAITHTGGALPPGLNYDSTSHRLSGAPTVSGRFTPVFTVEDTAGHSNSQAVPIAIDPLEITTALFLPDAFVGQSYSATLTATGVGTVTWTLATGSSPLPPGLSIVGNQIVGTPTVSCCFFGFTLRATDATGQTATFAVGISVRGALSITTTTLEDAVAIGGYGGCIGTANSVAPQFSVVAGSLPRGITLSPNGCFSGSAAALGTFSFTVRVDDGGRSASQALAISVSSALDQSAGVDTAQPAVEFGGATQIAEQVTAGVTGSLYGVRLMGLSCPVGTVLTAEVRGVDASGAPNASVFASGAATYNFTFPNPTLTIRFPSPATLAADQDFAVVFTSTVNCQVRPSTFDSYPGNGFVFTGGWKRLDEVDGRSDIPFQTLVVPPASRVTFLSTRRAAHTATMLLDNRILFAGYDRAAEIYDPATGLTTPTTGLMTMTRVDHATVRLDDGTVLITGGRLTPNGGPNLYLATAELFDPATGAFELLSSSMSTPRAFHRATRLADGRVLITGGVPIDGPAQELQSADIYSPGSRTFTSIASMTATRQQHTATLLADHRVLIASGFGTGFGGAELFDPTTNTFTSIAQPLRPHASHTATLLQNGRVLLAGGAGQNGATVNYADLFDPLTLTFSSAGTMKAFRVQHTATLLGDGSVLLAGGLIDGACCGLRAPQATLERFVPGSGFVGAGSMIAARTGHTAMLLPNGSVLFAGSWAFSSTATQSLETYQPAASPAVLNPNLPDGAKDVAYGPVILGAGGGSGGPYTWSLVSPPIALPPGLSFDTISCAVGCTVTGGTTVSGPTDLGRISGTPTAFGSYAFDVRVADAAGHTTDQTLRIRINGIDVTSPLQLADAHPGQPYSATLAATGVGPLTWRITFGSLPPGLTLNGDTISGTPTGSNVYYPFTVLAVDSIGQRATKSIAINVLSP